MHVSVHFVWYDMWIGVYYNRSNKTLYVCPLPMVLLKISLREPYTVVSMDDLEETFGKPDLRDVDPRNRADGLVWVPPKDGA